MKLVSGRRCCSPETEQLLGDIFQILPAPSMEAIAEQVNATVHQAAWAIMHLRSRAERHGWTIPHVRTNVDGAAKYVAILVDKGGVWLDAESADEIQRGGIASSLRWASQGKNQGVSFRAAAVHTKSPSLKRQLYNFADDADYLARKAKALNEELRLARDA